MTTHLWHIGDIANILRALRDTTGRGLPDDYTQGRLDALRDVATALGVPDESPPSVWVVRDDARYVTAVAELPAPPIVME
jgi:hypothetical protein